MTDPQAPMPYQTNLDNVIKVEQELSTVETNRRAYFPKVLY